MTFEEFNKLPIGTKITFSGIPLIKRSEHIYNEIVGPSSFIFEENAYKIQPCCGDFWRIFKESYVMNNIKLIPTPNNPQILKEKIQKISQEIVSKSNEKLKLECELETILKTERETILKNLVIGEWYKIQHIRGSYTFVKFSEIKTKVDSLTGYTIKHNFYEIWLQEIKTIEHIKGAREAEETFLKMLGE